MVDSYTTARVLIDGSADGPALVLTQPLSFLGGVDSESGLITDRSHSQFGLRVTGSVLVMPQCRGSSSSSNVFAEAIRLGTAPAAVLLEEADEILAIGAFVAQALYGRTVPMLELSPGSLPNLLTGEHVSITQLGHIFVKSTN